MEKIASYVKMSWSEEKTGRKSSFLLPEGKTSCM